ncbi:hypothetical protein ABPG73_008840 [Tetrahymena malaccensis]
MSLDFLKRWIALRPKLTLAKYFKKDKQNNEEKEENKKTKKLIEEQLNKHLDIFQIFQDVILLKKAIMILLDEDQLAAIRLVGCSSNYLDIGQNTQKKKIKKKSQNHFEDQLQILGSLQLQCEQVKLFLEKCQGNNQLDQVDKRILSSII